MRQVLYSAVDDIDFIQPEHFDNMSAKFHFFAHRFD